MPIARAVKSNSVLSSIPPENFYKPKHEFKLLSLSLILCFGGTTDKTLSSYRQ